MFCYLYRVMYTRDSPVLELHLAFHSPHVGFLEEGLHLVYV